MPGRFVRNPGATCRIPGDGALGVAEGWGSSGKHDHWGRELGEELELESSQRPASGMQAPHRTETNMTLALYGKSRERQGGLIFSAFMAIMVAAIGGVAVISTAFAHHNDWEKSRQCDDSWSGAASCAAARMCSTVLVEPPMATSRVMAFSKAWKVAIERGRTEASSCS